MSRPQSVATLEAKKADLLNQIKQVDTAIRAAKERETAKKSKAILDAIAARGLLDSDLETVLAAIAATAKASPAAPAATTTTGHQPTPEAVAD